MYFILCTVVFGCTKNLWGGYYYYSCFMESIVVKNFSITTCYIVLTSKIKLNLFLNSCLPRSINNSIKRTYLPLACTRTLTLWTGWGRLGFWSIVVSQSTLSIHFTPTWWPCHALVLYYLARGWPQRTSSLRSSVISADLAMGSPNDVPKALDLHRHLGA